MREFTIKKENENQRLDKYLSSLLSGASFSFLHKMLRKKNIVLNDKKAEGGKKLRINDNIKIYLSEETFNSLTGNENKKAVYEAISRIEYSKLNIVYENPDIVVCDKPFDILSQKAKPDDISINEVILSYLINNGLNFNDFSSYKPSVINRLDRNTGGLIICAKTRQAAVKLSNQIKTKKIRRIYYALVHGLFNKNGYTYLYYKKDSSKNIAKLFDKEVYGSSLIKTKIEFCKGNSTVSLIEAELFTGKSHQIRGTCNYLGFPILNDKKYGDKSLDERVLRHETDRLLGQYLYAEKIIFPHGQIIKSSIPTEFEEILNRSYN